jgi:hypothetical protein
VSFAPLNLKKYIGLRVWAYSCRAIVGLLLNWARQWPNLLGLAVSDPIFFKKIYFFKKIIFIFEKKNNALAVFFFQINFGFIF